MVFEILNGPFVFFSGDAGIESAQVSLSSGGRIKFARIKPVFSTDKFSYHKKLVGFGGETSAVIFSAKGMPARYGP
jgi:hypothetical protein